VNDATWAASAVKKANDLGHYWTGRPVDVRLPEDWKVVLTLAGERAESLIDWENPLGDFSWKGSEMLDTVVAVAAENVQEWTEEVERLDTISSKWWREMIRVSKS